MAFTVRRATALPPDRAWAALADLAGHARHVPLTVARTDPGTPRVGWTVTMVTSAGPLRMLDRMTVTEWVPGERLRVVKTGRPLAGWAELRVRPAAAGGALVEWTEEITTRVPGTVRLSRAVADRLSPALFGRIVDEVLAAAAREVHPVAADPTATTEASEASEPGEAPEPTSEAPEAGEPGSAR